MPQGNAQAYEAALAGFTKDSFNDTDSAIGAVAASGNPLALQVIEALQDGRLLFSRRQGLHPRQGRRGARRRDRQAGGRRRPPISRPCGSTIACAARSRPRSAA